MFKSWPLYAGLLAAVLTSAGCAQLIDETRTATRQTLSVFKPRATDRRELANEETDQWIQDVGVEGRGDRAMEIETDPLHKLFSTPKSRSIERSVGIGTSYD